MAPARLGTIFKTNILSISFYSWYSNQQVIYFRFLFLVCENIVFLSSLLYLADVSDVVSPGVIRDGMDAATASCASASPHSDTLVASHTAFPIVPRIRVASRQAAVLQKFVRLSAILPLQVFLSGGGRGDDGEEEEEEEEEGAHPANCHKARRD